jgi:predicted Zn finger-like uncharacterized protein
VIVECPECKTSHSKTEAELANGAAVVCRRCNKAFRLNAAGATELAPDAPSGGTFDHSSTSVMDVSSIKKNIATMRQPDIGLDLDAPALVATTKPVAAKPATVPASTAKPALAPSGLSSAADLFEGLDLDGLSPTPAPTKADVSTKAAPAASKPPAATKVDAPRQRSGDSADPTGLELASSPPGKDATLVKGARPSGPTQLGSHFGADVPTDMIKAAALKDKLAEMKKPNIESVPAGLSEQRPLARPARSSSPFGGPAFPRQTLQRFGTELADWARALPMPRRAALAAAVVVPLVLLAGGLIASLGAEQTALYVADTQPLWGGPLAGEAYQQLKVLERGARVEVFAEHGEFALVTDAMGRAGYLRTAALLDEQPAAAPELPFADCARAPVELSIERCQSRAQEQFDSCRGVCGKEADEPSCAGHCQERFGDCMRACEGDDEGSHEQKAAELPAAVRESPEEPKRRAPKKPAPAKKKKK